MHTLILLLTRPADLAVQIGCALVLIGAFLLAVRKVRRPDYRAIHRMERENGRHVWDTRTRRKIRNILGLVRVFPDFASADRCADRLNRRAAR